MVRAVETRAGRSRTAVVLLLAGFVALGGCSNLRDMFKDKKNKSIKPAELTEFAPTAKATRAWSTSVGDGEGRLGGRQGPVVADGRVFAAGSEGVGAWDLQTGKQVWYYADQGKDGDKGKDKDDKGDARLGISSSPGVGDGLLVVGGLDGGVLALDSASGAVKWRAKVASEVLAAPAIGQGLVLVRSIDGRVTAFDAGSGERKWFWQKETPALTVRGNSSPLLVPGAAFVGNDDGTLTALTLASGRLLWEQIVSPGEGRSELDRMADIDGTPVVDGTMLYVTSFKGETIAFDGPSGQPMWSHDAGGQGAVAVAPDSVVVSDPKGTVWALAKADGSAMWQQPALTRRNLSAAAVQGDYAVVGDFDGYLHWMRLADGAFAARARNGKAPIRGRPVVADGLLVVEDTDGNLGAWRISP